MRSSNGFGDGQKLVNANNHVIRKLPQTFISLQSYTYQAKSVPVIHCADFQVLHNFSNFRKQT